MHKMRKFDAKGFAFYMSPFSVNLSHFRIIQKARVHQLQSTKCNYQTFWLLLFCLLFNWVV